MCELSFTMNAMFDWPEQSHTSPMTTFLYSIFFFSHSTVMVYFLPSAIMGVKRIFQLPSWAAFVTILIITTPNLAALQDRVCFLLGYSPKQIQPCHEFYKLHIRPFTLKLLCKTYKEYGFEVLSHTSNYVIWKIKKRYLIYSRWLAKVFPGLGRSIIICGRKI